MLKLIWREQQLKKTTISFYRKYISVYIEIEQDLQTWVDIEGTVIGLIMLA
jgi:hypothetical protein